MGRIERSIEIKAQPEKAWSIVFWNRVPEWFDIIKKVEHTSEICGNSAREEYRLMLRNSSLGDQPDVGLYEELFRWTIGIYVAIGSLETQNFHC